MLPQNYSWYKIAQGLEGSGKYWTSIAASNLLPISEISEDLKTLINFGGPPEIAQLIDIHPLCAEVSTRLSDFCNYSEVTDFDQFIHDTNPTLKWDFALSGPTGPWQLLSRNDCEALLLTSDRENFEFHTLVNSLTATFRIADSVIIYRDGLTLPMESKINDPENCTLQFNVGDFGNHSSRKGSPRFRGTRLNVITAAGEKRESVLISEAVFDADKIFNEVGCKICFWSSEFVIIRKKK